MERNTKQYKYLKANEKRKFIRHFIEMRQCGKDENYKEMKAERIKRKFNCFKITFNPMKEDSKDLPSPMSSLLPYLRSALSSLLPYLRSALSS